MQQPNCLIDAVILCDTDPEDAADKQWAKDMGWSQRLKHTLKLWPYIVPLMAVYFAEYAMQTGTWTAIGITAAASLHQAMCALLSTSALSRGVLCSTMLRQLCCAELICLLRFIPISAACSS